MPLKTGLTSRYGEKRLNDPKRKRKPQMILVNSMSDLFHKDIPSPYIDRVFDVMEDQPRHVFQVLTKRSSLMRIMSPHDIRASRFHLTSGLA